MARIVNKYVIPDGDFGNTRAGAIKKIQQVFEANREAIVRSLYEHAELARIDRMPDEYSFFEGRVLDNLSEEYGGRDSRKRVKDKRTHRWRENDVDIEEALDKTLNNMILTPPAERGKRNFLQAIKSSNERMYHYIKSRMASMTREHGYYDGIPLGDLWWDESAEHTTYMIRTKDGKMLKAVLESLDDNSPEWHLYDMSTGKELLF